MPEYGNSNTQTNNHYPPKPLSTTSCSGTEVCPPLLFQLKPNRLIEFDQPNWSLSSPWHQLAARFIEQKILWYWSYRSDVTPDGYAFLHYFESMKQKFKGIKLQSRIVSIVVSLIFTSILSFLCLNYKLDRHRKDFIGGVRFKHTPVIVFKLPRTGSSWFNQELNRYCWPNRTLRLDFLD